MNHTADIAARAGIDMDELYRLASRRHLLLVVVYGSYARGDERPDSDLDIGFVETDTAVDPGEFACLSRKVEVSALRLNDARPELRLACAEEGIPLFEAAPGTFGRFREEARAAWEAFRPAWMAAKAAERGDAVPLSKVLPPRRRR